MLFLVLFYWRCIVQQSDLLPKMNSVLSQHPRVQVNPTRAAMIQEIVDNREALVSANGALVSWTRPESTGRSPKDTYIVRRAESEESIDWDSPNCIPLDPETFDMLWDDALQVFASGERLYVTDRVLGADSSYALPVKVVANRAWTALFSDNMFRPVPSDIQQSVFADKGFTLLTLLTTSWTASATTAGCGVCLTAGRPTWQWPWILTGERALFLALPMPAASKNSCSP